MLSRAEAKASAASGAAQATAASGCAGADGRDGPPLAGVLDVAALRKRLAAAEPSGSPRRDAEAAADETSRERRAAAAAVLRAALTEGRGRIETAFFDRRLTGRQAAAAIAWLTDRIVAATVQFVIERAPGGGAGARSERLSVIAVGGYGRGEMAPFSDVDLLFLTPYKTTAWAETVVEGVLYMLWDLKLKVGHATRTVDECLRLAAQDMTIRTTLLETRLIEGSSEAYETLERRLRGELLPGAGSAFVRAKLAEREERHERTGGSRYMLEPHVKDGKGGLRDIHTLYWISGHLYGSHDRAALIEKGVFTAEETSRLENAANHLWTVRCGMHYVAGRAQEKLTFDLQVELAERFGYRRTTGARPVERFMKRTYIAARAIGELTRIFCAALEQQHQKDPPLLGGLRRLFPTARRGAPAPDGMEMKDGRLTLSDPAAIAERPILLLRLFEEAIRAEILTHPHALRIAARARRPVERLREDPEAMRLLCALITASADPVRALRRLNETGMLSWLLPDFGRAVGLMTFNMYHHYTVDEHTILTIDILNQIARGALREAHPIETEIAQALPDLRVMTVALLLHDVGKALPEDHSVAGARIAREVCPQLGLNETETDAVAWLIRNHLLMSDTAQRRDVSDPATVRAFADVVRSPARLRMLYLLTACDISGVGPNVWNGWKAQLLRQLYQETGLILAGADTVRSRAERLTAAKEALAQALEARAPDLWTEAARAAHLERFYPTYWLGAPLKAQLLHAEMMGPDAPGGGDSGGGEDAKPMFDMRVEADGDARRVAFLMADHPGLFARIAGALAIAGASVVDARADTTKDGMAVNTFRVRDAKGAFAGGTGGCAKLRKAVERALQGEVVASAALKARRKLKARERSFVVPPSVSIDNQASDAYTVIEVNGRDRVGLLYDLARALASENVSIFTAIIATYGEHAVDVFYVKDLFGMKITQPAKRRRVEAALLTAVARAGES